MFFRKLPDKFKLSLRVLRKNMALNTCGIWKRKYVEKIIMIKHCDQRRRIKTEEKANVVAAVLGRELIQFLAAPG